MIQTGKWLIAAIIILLAGCGAKSEAPVSQEKPASPKPTEKAAVKNEPIIFINGSSIKKRIDNFSISPDMKTIMLEEVKGNDFHMFETHLSNGQWSDPVMPSFGSTSVSEGTPSLSRDLQKVYFHSFRAMPGQQSPSPTLDLWVAERKEQGWNEPKPLGIPKAATDFFYYPTVSDKGTVYFTSNRPEDSKGKEDIYRSRFVNGSYQQPEHLGDEINSVDVDGFPHIAGDESVLLFSRSNDLFVSYNQEGRWTQAKPLGLNQFGIRRLRSPVLSSDQKQLYFVGDKDGNSHIFQVSWPFP